MYRDFVEGIKGKIAWKFEVQCSSEKISKQPTKKTLKTETSTKQKKEKNVVWSITRRF